LIKSENDLKEIVKYWFKKFSSKLSFAKGWIQKFYPLIIVEDKDTKKAKKSRVLDYNK